jgi:hypothetical protein
MGRAPAVVAALCLAGACGSDRELPADEVPPAADGSAPAAGDPMVAPGVAPSSLATACARRSQRVYVTGTAEARPFLTRRWVLCSAKGLLQRPQAGMEIRADGRFSLLAWTAEGALRALTGIENEGTVSFRATDQTGQVDFYADLGGDWIVHPVWGTDPRVVSYDNNGVERYDYVAAEELSPVPASAPPPPITGPLTGAAACGQNPGVRVVLSTVADARLAMSRRWVLCSEMGLTHEPQAGLEITPDDHFYLLERGPDGALVRQRGLRTEGLVQYLDIAPGIGLDHPEIQVNFDVGGGFVVSHPAVSRAPAFLIINNNGVYTYRYVAAE